MMDMRGHEEKYTAGARDQEPGHQVQAFTALHAFMPTCVRFSDSRARCD